MLRTLPLRMPVLPRHNLEHRIQGNPILGNRILGNHVSQETIVLRTLPLRMNILPRHILELRIQGNIIVGNRILGTMSPWKPLCSEPCP